jgi:hypothetical protein
MKTKLATLLIATASVAHANLIDLTPGGFQPFYNPPPAFYQFFHEWNVHHFDYFDSATTDGWGHNGILNGGTYFLTDLIGHPEQSTNVSWDFSTLPGWSMSRILLEGRAADGTSWDNIYAVPHNLREFDALETVLIADGVDIYQISFFGRWPGSPVPDSGSTLLLSALGLAALVAARIALPGMVGKHLSVSRSLRESLPNRRRLGASVERPD